MSLSEICTDWKLRPGTEKDYVARAIELSRPVFWLWSARAGDEME